MPGPAAICGIIRLNGTVIETYSEKIGIKTNNQAEYRALIAGLLRAKKGGVTMIECYLDSELLDNQLNFRYKIKDAELARLFKQVHDLRSQFQQISFMHIPREKNAAADRLVNNALDEHHL